MEVRTGRGMGYSKLHSLAWMDLEVSMELLWFWGFCRAPQGAAPLCPVLCDPGALGSSKSCDRNSSNFQGWSGSPGRSMQGCVPSKALPCCWQPTHREQGPVTAPHTLGCQGLIPCQHIVPVSRGMLTPWVISCINALSLIIRCFNVVRRISTGG